MPRENIILFLWSTLIAFPLLLGLYRIKKIDIAFFPFIAILACGLLAECLRFFQIWLYFNQGVKTNFIIYNVYILVIAFLYLQLFYNWGTIGTKKWVLYFMWGLLFAVWLLDHVLLGPQRIFILTAIFRMTYSSLLCLLAIHQINRLIVNEKQSLLKNPKFLICISVLLFFVLYIIQESVILFDPKISKAFFKAIFIIRSRISTFIYLLFFLAILWIPPKKIFIQL